MDSSSSRLAALAIALVGATSIVLGARAALPLLSTAMAPPDASQVGLTIVLLVAGFWLFVGGLGMISRARSGQRR